jgi:hypothetical protein
MFTYVIVLAVQAFIPYVATPAAEQGVKAIVSHHDDTESGGVTTPVLVAQNSAPAVIAPDVTQREAH